MFFTQHSLFNIPCLTLLLLLLLLVQRSLLNIVATFAILTRHYLFKIPCSTLLLFLLIFVQHYYCCSLFDIACLMLFIWCFLLDAIVAPYLTLLLWHSLLMLMLLLLSQCRCFFLLFLAQHYY
jgi:hypothetical protein